VLLGGFAASPKEQNPLSLALLAQESASRQLRCLAKNHVIQSK